MPSVHRALRLRLVGDLPPALLLLLRDYRLLVNEVVREALVTGKTARGSMSRFARDRARVHQFTGNHAIIASEIALSLAKGHRGRLRRGLPSQIPYVRRPFLRTDPKSFRFDIDSGKVRLSLRYGEWCSFFVEVAPYHRETLSRNDVRIKQLHVSEQGVVLFLEKSVPEPYVPTSLLALDTNESSLDGVTVAPAGSRTARVGFPEARVIQARHSKRRRDLQRRKAHDRRVAKKLLGKEGRREHHRVESRLHALSKRLVEAAARAHAAIALEDLTHPPPQTPTSELEGGRPSSEAVGPFAPSSALDLAPTRAPSPNRVQVRRARSARLLGQPVPNFNDLPEMWGAPRSPKQGGHGVRMPQLPVEDGPAAERGREHRTNRSARSRSGRTRRSST